MQKHVNKRNVMHIDFCRGKYLLQLCSCENYSGSRDVDFVWERTMTEAAGKPQNAGHVTSSWQVRSMRLINSNELNIYSSKHLGTLKVKKTKVSKSV